MRDQILRVSMIIFLAPVLILGQPEGHVRQRLHTVLSSEQRKHILDGEFTMETTVAGLPEAVRTALADVFGQNRLKMANPGESFQESDMMGPGRALPLRRLIFAGISRQKCFVHYERGGRGHGYYIIVFKMQQVGASSRAGFAWAGAEQNVQARDLEELRTQVSAGRFKDDEAYIW